MEVHGHMVRLQRLIQVAIIMFVIKRILLIIIMRLLNVLMIQLFKVVLLIIVVVLDDQLRVMEAFAIVIPILLAINVKIVRQIIMERLVEFTVWPHQRAMDMGLVILLLELVHAMFLIKELPVTNANPVITTGLAAFLVILLLHATIMVLVLLVVVVPALHSILAQIVKHVQ